MGALSEYWEQESEAATAWARSIGRQFDDQEGGGFADEAAAVVDPTRSASQYTEERLRDSSDTVWPNFADLSFNVSDDLDEGAGVTPPDEREPTPETTPEGDDQLFSGLDPGDTEDYSPIFQWALENIDIVVVGVLGIYVLSVLAPALEIAAGVVEE